MSIRCRTLDQNAKHLGDGSPIAILCVIHPRNSTQPNHSYYDHLQQGQSVSDGLPTGTTIIYSNNKFGANIDTIRNIREIIMTGISNS